ncbi:MAG TPA: ABC transporter substrate-binding protein, partial [Acidimicrobiia bacterium]|nr:ABC transporter substrate-binding protein [Acidimicrobiia bacterium]
MRSANCRLRALAAAAALVVCAACGQKAGVAGPDIAAAPPPATAATGTIGVVAQAPLSATGATGAAVAGLPPSVPSTPAPTAGARSVSGPASLAPLIGHRTGPAPVASSAGATPSAAAAAPNSSTPPPAAGAPAAAPAAGPHDRDGVSDKEIVIGIHAPLTGAAPVPEDSVDKAKDLYWKFIAERGGIFGRNVRVVFRDDQYNPSRAVAVCREMVEEEHAFLLVGVGTDQVVSCARYASQAGVPYFSMGGGEAAVAGIRNYFGISMSFPQQ